MLQRRKSRPKRLTRDSPGLAHCGPLSASASTRIVRNFRCRSSCRSVRRASGGRRSGGPSRSGCRARPRQQRRQEDQRRHGEGQVEDAPDHDPRPACRPPGAADRATRRRRRGRPSRSYACGRRRICAKAKRMPLASHTRRIAGINSGGSASVSKSVSQCHALACSSQERRATSPCNATSSSSASKRASGMRRIASGRAARVGPAARRRVRACRQRRSGVGAPARSGRSSSAESRRAISETSDRREAHRDRQLMAEGREAGQ
jgi:hypothetical protein